MNEGLAEYGNTDPSFSYEGALLRAIETGRLNPLWYQRTFVGKPGDIIAAYGQASSVVLHMVSRHGNDKMAELMRAMHATQDIDKALERVYELDQHTLDAEWREARGLESLPPAEEAAPEPPASQPRPSPEPTIKALTVTPRPPKSATPTAVPVAPTETVAVVPEQSQQEESQSSGCGASLNHGGVFDLALIALLAGPFAGLWGRGLFRRNK